MITGGGLDGRAAILCTSKCRSSALMKGLERSRIVGCADCILTTSGVACAAWATLISSEVGSRNLTFANSSSASSGTWDGKSKSAMTLQLSFSWLNVPRTSWIKLLQDIEEILGLAPGRALRSANVENL